MDLLSVLLCLFSIYYIAGKNPARLAFLILLTIPVLLFSKSFSVNAVFRILTVLTAFLPADYSLGYLLHSEPFSQDINGFFQTDISFFRLTVLFLPVFIIALICVQKIKNRSVWKKYLPFAMVLLITLLAGLLFPSVRNLCQFVFIYTAAFAILHLEEVYLYKNCKSVVAHLPFFFLYMTSLLNIQKYYIL